MNISEQEYKEALGRAKRALKDGTLSPHTIALLKDIFPVLRISEDERIREKLIELFHDTVSNDEIFSDYGLDKTEVLSWLENQNSNVDNANKEYWRGYREGKQEILDKYAELEKQGKKESNDKNEPKFKVGVWCRRRDGGVKRPIKITKVLPLSYEAVNDIGYHHSIEKDCLENNYDLWTIDDAKDGDVLATSAGAFIYNGNRGGGSCPGSYCGIDTLGRFKTGVETHWTGKTVNPATNEQRDTLFAKMKEAGYEWNAENKELKMIEQKPAEWSQEDEEHYKACLQYFDEVKPDMVYYKDYQWLKSIKPQNRWKPTALQMTVLQNAASDNTLSCEDLNTLSELYEQLKKL